MSVQVYIIIPTVSKFQRLSHLWHWFLKGFTDKGEDCERSGKLLVQDRGSSGIPSKGKRNKFLLRLKTLLCLVTRGFILTAMTKQCSPDKSMHWYHKPESIGMKESRSSFYFLDWLTTHIFCFYRNAVTWNNKSFSLLATWFLGLTNYLTELITNHIFIWFRQNSSRILLQIMKHKMDCWKSSPLLLVHVETDFRTKSGVMICPRLFF